MRFAHKLFRPVVMLNSYQSSGLFRVWLADRGFVERPFSFTLATLHLYHVRKRGCDHCKPVSHSIRDPSGVQIGADESSWIFQKAPYLPSKCPSKVSGLED